MSSPHAALLFEIPPDAACLEALRRTVTRDSVVADIGAGGGIFALVAARLGARRVYAVGAEDAGRATEEVARRNGLDEQIRFIRRPSREVTLEEPANVIVSAPPGVLPRFAYHRDLIDARRRLLAPNGALIPAGHAVRAVPLRAEAAYADLVSPWEQAIFDLELSAPRRKAVNAWYEHRPTADDLLAEPVTFATLDYRSRDDAIVDAQATWSAARGGTMHGFGLWLDALFEGDKASLYTDKPPMPPAATAFFPLETPVEVRPGDGIRARFNARPLAEDYVWRWDIQVTDGGDPQRIRLGSRQSTFSGAALNLEHLDKGAADYHPRLGPRGRALKRALDAMHAGLTLGEIAARLASELPKVFPSREAAMQFVSRTASVHAGDARSPD